MEIYGKLVDRFHDLSKVKNPAARQRSNNYLDLSKENVLRNMMLSYDHALLESSSRYGFTKFLNYFFSSSNQVLEIYVLNIEENYLI